MTVSFGGGFATKIVVESIALTAGPLSPILVSTSAFGQKASHEFLEGLDLGSSCCLLKLRRLYVG